MKELYRQDLTSGLNAFSDLPAQLSVELLWQPTDATQRRGLSVDCDLSCVVCGKDGKLLQGISSQVPTYGHSICHQGDDLSGALGGERLELNLQSLPERVAKVGILLNVYSLEAAPRDLGMVGHGTLRLLSGGEVLYALDLTGQYDGMQGLIVGEFLRCGAGWSFRPMGLPVEEAPNVHSLFMHYV